MLSTIPRTSAENRYCSLPAPAALVDARVSRAENHRRRKNSDCAAFKEWIRLPLVTVAIHPLMIETGDKPYRFKFTGDPRLQLSCVCAIRAPVRQNCEYERCGCESQNPRATKRVRVLRVSLSGRSATVIAGGGDNNSISAAGTRWKMNRGV